MRNECLPKGKIFQGIVFLFMIFVCNLFFADAEAQATLYSRGSGAFGTITWSGTSHATGNCLCTPGDLTHLTSVAVIGNGHLVTLSSGGTTTVGGIVVNDDGNGGTFTYGSAATTSTLNVNGDISVKSGGIFQSGSTVAGSHTISLSGNLINDGTVNMTANAATNHILTFSGLSAKAIKGAAGTTRLYNMSIAAISGTVTFGDNANSRTLIIANDLTVGSTLQSGSTAAVAHTIQLAGNLTNNSTVDLTANSATNQSLTFNNTTAVAIKGSSATTSVYNMNVTGTGTVSFGDNAASTRTLNILNDLTISTGSTLQSGNTGANTHTMTLSGSVINNGTFNMNVNTPTAQTATFNSASAEVINGTGTAITFYNMNVNGAGALSFGDNTATTRTLTVINDLTVGASGILQSGNTAAVAHTLVLSGNLINNGSIDMTANGATNHTTTLNSTSAKSIKGSGSTTTFYTMNVNGTGALSFGDNTATSRTLNVVNDLTIASGATLQSANSGTVAQTIQLSGNLIDNGTFNLTANAATNQSATFTSSATKTIRGTATTINLYFMNVNGPGALNFGDNANTRTLNIASDLTIGTSGTFYSGSTAAITHTLQLSGNLINNGAIDMTVNSATNQIATFNASSAKSIKGSGATITFNTMNVNGTGALSFGDNTATSRTLAVNADLTVAASATLQSGATGSVLQTLQLSGNLINNGTLNLTANSAVNQTTTFNSSAAKAIKGTGTATTLYDMNVVGTGALTFADNTATSRTLKIADDLTIATSSSFQSGSSAAVAQTVQIGGDVTNNGTFNLTANAATNQALMFIGSVNAAVSGTGTFTFRNVTMNTTGASNVNLTSSFLINGTLNFAADGLLTIDANSNITLGSAATITGYNSARYIQVSGSTGANSNIIKTSSGATASWQITYPIGTATGGYSPFVMPTVAGTAPTAASTISVTAIFNASIQGQLRRTFRIVITGNAAATTFSGPQFGYSTSADVSGGDALSNYTTIWYLSKSGGSWTSVAGTAPGSGTFTVTTPAHNLVTGTYYYTIGASDAYPNTWYSYQAGVWSNWQNWTSDPSGTTLVNGLNLPPQPGDEIVILNGINITNDVSGQVVSNTTIQSGATLDMVATSSNTLGTVSGAGLLRIQGVNLPSGTYTNFVTTTGGTVEYYNTGGTLPATQATYNKLIFSNSSTTSDATFITVNNLIINGTFNITQTGASHTVTWQINDATSTGATAVRTMTIAGDLTVSSGGKITVGTGNPTYTTQHTLALSGNFINNGIVQFFDPTDASFSSTNYTSGNTWTTALKGNAVNVTFTGIPDATLTCNNQTDFYRLIVNKGSSQQPVMTIYSSNASNFRLFGPNNINNNVADNTSVSSESLSIWNGTLQLTGFITIPNLIVNGGAGIGGGWPIPQTAALWMNSANITIQATTTSDTGDNGRQIYVYGLLRLTNGTLNMGFSRGLLGGGSGVFQVEGGTLNTRQLRTTYLGSNNRFSYNQTGGVVNVGTAGITGVDVQTYPRFALPYPECTFIMSGGTLNVADPTSAGTSVNGAILISAATSNISVTGGDVYATLPASAINFTITSTAPFYNLYINKIGSGTSVCTLNSMTFNDGTGYTRPVQPLTILKNLSIITGNSPSLVSNNQILTIAGNFDLQASTTYTPGTGTTIFNGTGAQSWTNNGTITALSDVIVNKASGTLTLGGAQVFPNITGATTGLTLTSGTLDDGGKTITVTGALTNNAVHTTTVGGGVIVVNGATSIGGSGGVFGNLTISTNAAVSTSGDQTVTKDLRLTAASSSLNIQSNNLTVLGNIYDAASGVTQVFTTTKRIQTAGLRNDGGLTRQATSATDLLFPVGVTSTTAYTPASINVTAATAGKITMRPVTGVHPTATPSGQSLQYYWRVSSTGFVGVSAVTHKSYTFNSTSLLQGTLTSYKPARYDAATFTWAVGTTYNATGTTVIFPSTSTFSFGTSIDGEYTTGNINAGTIAVFYSRQNGNWNDNNTWSVTPCSGAGACGAAVTSGLFPSSTSAVVIGDLNNSHTVTIDANSRTCGTLYIENTSTLDCSTFTSLNFGVNTSQTVNGRGTLRIAAVTGGIGVFPGGDFTNFIGPIGGTIEWYGATKILPTTGPSGLVLDNYYNLITNPSSGQTISLPPSNLTIYNNFTTNGSNSTSITATDKTALLTRTITISGNLNVSAGTFNIVTNIAPNANTALSNFILTGDLTIASSASFAVSGGTATHSITSNGNITNNGTLDFLNGSVMNLTFSGTANTSFSGTTATLTRLNNVVVNKGTSQTPTVTVSVLGSSISTLNTGWLTLTSGTLNFNNAATYNLSTASSSYSIPAAAKLKVQASTVTVVSAANDNADLLLSGAIEVAGGTLNIGTIGNANNNDIEYASAGNPSITVSSGNLNVNGAVRRSTSTLSGALAYNQSAGIVTVGGFNCTVSPNNTRGVFEIENNSGSSFTLTGGTLNVQRSTAGSSFADLYINPATSSVLAASFIQLGMNVNTSVSATLSMNIVPAVGNLSLLGNATTAQTVNMRSNPLTTLGTLTINSNSTLNTNALDVTIGGDLSIAGTYNGTILTGNTTTFNGSGAQSGSLTSGSTFQNITINKAAGTATLTGTTSINNLNILKGILSVSGTLNINGDITNNSSQIGAGTINFQGTGSTTAHTINSTVGSFTNLSIGGTETTKKITVNGNLTINGVLDFGTGGTSRYFFIGSNQLTFSQAGSIYAANISNTRFIRTNGVSSDLGVVKNWPTGSSVSFTYAVGTRTNYTPVTYTLNVTNAGDITVIPVDDQHPTANATGEQILNYYWIVKRNSSLVLSNNTGTQLYQFPTSLIGGASGTLIAAHLDAINLIGWTRSPGNGGSFTPDPPVAPTAYMNFTNQLNTNFPTAGGEFHYTAGTVNTLPNPVTPVYSRFADADGVSNPTSVSNMSTGGNWNLATNWTLSATGNGTALSTVPTGRPIVILPGARMNMNISGLTAFTSQINGLMVIASTTGHNLGSISGTGTLRTSISTLPAGNYTTFVSSAGGTIEYAAPITMNSRSTYNNLNISAAGTVTMTNTDLVLNGGLTIAASATLDNSSFNRDISVAKDWINSGTFNTGTGTVTFAGTTAQSITGSTAFYDLEILKTGNLTLSGTGATSVGDVLTLTTGYVIASSTNPLTIGSSATVSGGSASSFVQGPVKRNISSGGTFTYPLGSTLNSQYRPATISSTNATDTWTAQYVGHNPSLDSYNYKTMNATNLGKVSMFEYWDIARVLSTSATVTLSYNTGSYIPSDIGTVANLRVAHWDGTKWDFPTGGGTFSQAGTITAGTVTVTNVTSFSPFTLGSLDTSSPLPVKWLGVTAERDGNTVLLNWRTAVEMNNDHFEIERSTDNGMTFNSIGSKLAVGNSNTPQSYQFTDSEVSKSKQYYYRIKQVDVDGAFDYSAVVVVNATGETLAGNNWIGLPNPVRDSQDFNIILSKNATVDSDAPVQLQVMTSAGIVLFEGADVLEKMNTSLQTLFQTVSSGIYIVQISDGVNHQVIRVARY